MQRAAHDLELELARCILRKLPRAFDVVAATSREEEAGGQSAHKGETTGNDCDENAPVSESTVSPGEPGSAIDQCIGKAGRRTCEI